MRLCDVETTEMSSTNNVCADQQKRRHHWIFTFSRLADGLVKSEFKKCTKYKQNCISVEGVSKTMHEQTGHCNMTFFLNFFFYILSKKNILGYHSSYKHYMFLQNHGAAQCSMMVYRST